ncbi:MAG: hypothetical protein C0467_13190 [Planctomycetaceae bacterium]|nr:hypothetical protein [Planctomycetaceae bacterium]
MFRFFATLAVVVSLSHSTQAADPLDQALVENAKSVLDTFKQKKFTNVGVLKFLVRQGDGPARDDVGDLNLTLANKTEVALILANTDDGFGVIDRASDAVMRAKLLTANHKTEDGRKAFFGRKYELAWSRDKVEPGVFLTGVATFSADLSKFTVRFQWFDKTGKMEDLQGEVSVTTTPELLGQCGFSYVIAAARQKAILAGEAVTPEAQRRDALEKIVAPNTTEVDEPISLLTTSPIKWGVLYNGKPVKVSGNVVPEPKEDDRVEFTLTNPGPGTYGVVLLVNGESTLYQERSAPLVCRKWVLSPNTTVTVRGFQTGPDTLAPFRVLPPDEVPEDAVNYGEHAGTFRMVVFHGKSVEATEPGMLVKRTNDDSAVFAVASTRGTRTPGAKPQTLKALQADLRGRNDTSGSRGYVVKGSKTEKFETNAVDFVTSPELPVADVSLRYFTPKK